MLRLRIVRKGLQINILKIKGATNNKKSMEVDQVLIDHMDMLTLKTNFVTGLNAQNELDRKKHNLKGKSTGATNTFLILPIDLNKVTDSFNSFVI